MFPIQTWGKNNNVDHVGISTVLLFFQVFAGQWKNLVLRLDCFLHLAWKRKKLYLENPHSSGYCCLGGSFSVFTYLTCGVIAQVRNLLHLWWKLELLMITSSTFQVACWHPRCCDLDCSCCGISRIPVNKAILLHHGSWAASRLDCQLLIEGCPGTESTERLMFSGWMTWDWVCGGGILSGLVVMVAKLYTEKLGSVVGELLLVVDWNSSGPTPFELGACWQSFDYHCFATSYIEP